MTFGNGIRKRKRKINEWQIFRLILINPLKVQSQYFIRIYLSEKVMFQYYNRPITVQFEILNNFDTCHLMGSQSGHKSNYVKR